MENKWNERIDQFIQAQRENILRDIGRLVAVPSVEGPAAPGAPFGPGPRAALDEALDELDHEVKLARRQLKKLR